MNPVHFNRILPTIQLSMIVMIVLSVMGHNRVIFAQVIKADVQLQTDRLSFEEKSYLEGLQNELVSLINNTQWKEKPYNYELPLRINVFYENSYQPTTFHRYSAGIMVATTSGIQLRDNKWEFRYSRDDRLHFGNPYDTFTGCIEMYILICYGFEADRINPLGGQPYYEKALIIAENARFENKYNLGWDYRRDLINALIQKKSYRNLRTAAYHVYAGDYYANRSEITQARSHLVHAADLLMSDKPELMELHFKNHILRFVDVKQLVEGLNKTGAEDTIDKLESWDSDHPERYR